MSGTTLAGACEDGTGVSIDPQLFRRTCGRFGTGVTVVTTRVEGRTHGMTANAFMSVSLEPPLVLVSIARRAKMCELLEKAGRYGVSILAEDQRELALHFAGRPQEVEIPFGERAGMPVIEGALAHVVARVVQRVDAGDHVLFIGEVEHMGCREGAPLLFFGGRFETLAEAARDAHSEVRDGGARR